MTTSKIQDMLKYKAIIFDFDNTLVDTGKPFIAYTDNFLRKHELSEYTVRQFYKETNTLTGTSNKIDKTITDEFWGGLKSALDGNINLYKEDENAISLLHKSGVTLGIISRSSKQKIENILLDENILDNFEIILENAQKPDPVYMVELLKSLNLNKQDVLYVGDEQEDIEFAKNSGVASCYVLRNNNHSIETHNLHKDWLDNNKPDYTIHSLRELVEIAIA